MKNIFNQQDKKETLARFYKLDASSHRLWGTMHAEEMLWHLRSQLELALGVIPQTTNVKTALSKPPLRWLALYVLPWKKGLKTAQEMNVKKINPAIDNIETERRFLLQRLEEVAVAQKLHGHPLFGEMSKQLWGRLIWKHFDHHLRQFGC